MTIPVIGIPASDIVPGAPFQANFAAGVNGLGSAPLKMLIIANMLAAGTGVAATLYGPDTPVPMNSEDDAAALFGARSEARYMVRWAKRVAPNLPLYVCPAAESAGVNASGTITVTGTTANAAGYVRVRLNRAEYVDVPFNKGDAIATIATAIDTYMKSMAYWPLTTSPSAGVVTVTAAQKGLRGNRLKIGAQVFPADGTTGITVSPTTMTALASGTVSDSWTAVLATIIGKRFYFIASADDGAGTGLLALQTQLDADALPAAGNRQCVIVGATDTLANNITEATTLNDPRIDIVAQVGGDVAPCILAAAACAAFALGETSLDPLLCNFDGWGSVGIPGIGDTSQFWPIPAPLVDTKLTRPTLNSGLTSGLTMVQVGDAGRSFIVKRITSKFLTSSQYDYRIRDPHKRAIVDRFGDDSQAAMTSAMAGKVIGDAVPVNQRNPNPLLFTTDDATAIVKNIVLKYQAKSLLQQVDSVTLAPGGIVAQRDSGAPTRITTMVNLVPVDVLDQAPIVANQQSASL